MLYLLYKSKNLTLIQEARDALEDNPKNNALFCIYLKDYLLRVNDTYIPFKRTSNVIPDLCEEDVIKFNTLFKANDYKSKRQLEEGVYTRELLCSLYQDHKENRKFDYKISNSNSYRRRIMALMQD